MPFKMSDRSLFAILLRSPWWASLLIVLVFSLAARALLPAEYVVVGVLGTFPFMVIAVMAAWRQWRVPGPARLQAVLERVAETPWREFADQVEQVLARRGYVVKRLDGQAADFLIERQGQTSMLSCRRWKAGSHGVEALRSLQVACQAQGAGQGLYLSLRPVSEPARRYAQDEGIVLLHGEALAQWLV